MIEIEIIDGCDRVVASKKFAERRRAHDWMIQHCKETMARFRYNISRDDKKEMNTDPRPWSEIHP